MAGPVNGGGDEEDAMGRGRVEVRDAPKRPSTGQKSAREQDHVQPAPNPRQG